jgi:regulator of sigma E protease
MSVAATIIGFLLVMGPLVFIHEFGHFLFAKLGRIRVIEFGFGYPPRIWKFWQSQGHITIAGMRITIPKNFKAPLPREDAVRLFKPAQEDKSAGFGALDNLALPTDVMSAMENGRYVEALVAVQPHGEHVLQKIKLLDPSTRDTEKAPSDWQLTPESQLIIGDVTDYVPGTEYTLNWLPVGGFTRMLGEEDPSAPDSFAAAPKRWRTAVLLAGPLFNLAMAVFIFILMFMAGVPEPRGVRVVIASVQPGSPAAAAGLEPDDLILSINNQPTTSMEQVTQIAHANLGKQITIGIQRGQEKLDLHATPRRADQYDPKTEGPLGITIGLTATQGYALQSYSLFQAAPRGFNQAVSAIGFIVVVPVQVIRGLIPLDLARPVGPVGIGEIAGAQLQESIRLRGLYPILQLAGLLSIALGITNLLPLPALDGGRLLFVLAEVIRRRRVDPKKETIVHLIGMALLLTLMLVITLQDILNPIVLPKTF